MPPGIPSPMNNRLIDALFSVWLRIREIRNEMDKFADEGSETVASKDDSEDFHRFKSSDPSIHSHKDKQDPRTPPPLSVSVTRSGKRRVIALREQHMGRRYEAPRMLLSTDTITRI